MLIASLYGCGGGAMDYNKLIKQVGDEDCQGSFKYLTETESKYGTNQKLLYLMDSGAVNLYCGKYSDGNKFLHDAEQLSEELWTKSISKEGASFLINDYTIAYGGEDFEKAFINMMSAMSYAAMGSFDEALVECRRLNSKLNIINAKYETKSVYKEDAFGRYLSGLIYEATGPGNMENIDNAFIDYSKAYDVYKSYAADYSTPMPNIFLEDYMRVAEAAGRADEVKSKIGSPVNHKSHKEAKKLGRIVLVHLNGRSPAKVEEVIESVTPIGIIKLAFPKYETTYPLCRKSELLIEDASAGVQRVQTEMVEDVSAIAVKNLADRRGRVIAKTIARAVAKQAAIEASASLIKDKYLRSATRFGLSAVGSAMEKADTRTWRTLPGEIYLGRAFVKPGTYKVSAVFCEGRQVQIGEINLKPGETRFLLVDTLY